MNLWFRLFWVLVTSCFQPRLILPDQESRLLFRVGLCDLDTSLHMNNGRYLALMDLGRLDVMVRGGLWRAVLSNKWVPIASAIMIRYRRELGFIQKFELKTRLLCWEDQSVVMEQTFIIVGGPRNGQTAAHALFKGGLYDRRARGFVSTNRLMEIVGVTAVSPAPDSEVAAFLEANREMKIAMR